MSSALLAYLAGKDMKNNMPIKKQKVTKVKYKEPELQHAYEMGIDRAKNGANESNCHFGLFSTKEKMMAWTEGSNVSFTTPKQKK